MSPTPDNIRSALFWQISFPFLEFYINWNHIYSLRRLSSLAQHNAFDIHSRLCIPFHCWVRFHGVTIHHCVYPCICEITLDCFQFGVTVNKDSINILIHIFVWIYMFSFLFGKYLKMEQLSLMEDLYIIF